MTSVEIFVGGFLPLLWLGSFIVVLAKGSSSEEAASQHGKAAIVMAAVGLAFVLVTLVLLHVGYTRLSDASLYPYVGGVIASFCAMCWSLCAGLARERRGPPSSH